MALNNIILQQANGIKVFYPITRMFTEPLYNVTRSSNRWEGFRVSRLCSVTGQLLSGQHVRAHALPSWLAERALCV